MWTKRIKDILAMLLIGDGALTLIGARERALVWRFGPQGLLRESTSWQADHPGLMRLEGVASIALGALLAWRQYRESPPSWASVEVGRMAERRGLRDEERR